MKAYLAAPLFCYKLAFNRHRLGRLKYVMERSLTKTLARKYRVSVPRV